MCAEVAASEGDVVVASWGGAVAQHYVGGDLVSQGRRARRPGRCNPWDWSGWYAEAAASDFGATFVVCERSSCVARAMRRSCRAALRLACERGTPEQRLRILGCAPCE